MVLTKINRVLSVFAEKRLTTVAGAWVFFFLTSVLPLAFLLVTAFGVFGVDLSLELVSRLPLEFRPAGEAIVSTAERASKSATVIFVFSVLFSGSTLLKQMSKDGDHIYGVDSKVKRGVMRRVWAVFGIAFLFTAFLAVAFLIAFGGELLNPVFNVEGKSVLSTLAVFLVAILFCYFIIVLLNRFIAPVKLKFSEVAIGSLCSLFVIVLGTIGFTLYLRYFNSYNAFYGSLAGIVVFLLWVYIMMLGLVVGVIINGKIVEGRKQNS